MTAFGVMSEMGLDPALGMRSMALGTAEPVAGWPAFQAEIERSLVRLRGTHLRLSLFQVRLGTRAHAGMAMAALSDLGATGRLPDGSLGLLYLGPRPEGIGGEVALGQRIERRLLDALGPVAPRAASIRSQMARPQVAVVHAWSDELTGVGGLIRLLLAWETPLNLLDLAAA